MKRSWIFVLPIAACTSGPAGYLLGPPVAVTTKREPSVRVRLPGFEETPPAVAALDPFAQLPAQLLAGLGGSVAADQPVIAAMSLGLEELEFVMKDGVTVVTEGGGTVVESQAALLEVGKHGWTAIGFGVAPGELDAPIAPHIAEDDDSEHTVNRTVYSYFLPDSYVEGLEIEADSVRAMDPEGLSMSDPNDVLYALDLHMAMYHTDLADYVGLFTQRSLPPPDDVWCYFTLDPGFVTAHGAAVASAWMTGVDASTIYMTHFQAGRWSTPEVYMAWSELNFTRGGSAAPIDALSIDAPKPGTRSSSDHVMFSLAGSQPYARGPENQLLYTSPDTPDPPRRIIISDDVGYRHLGNAVGAGNNVADTCVGDPDYRQQGGVNVDRVLDDFFVGRRLSTAPWSVVDDVVLVDEETFLEAPLALAASGYRYVVDPSGAKLPFMRACMSWPKHCIGATGKAFLHFGRVRDYTSVPGGEANFQWDGTYVMAYTGEPLQRDIELVGRGFLRSGRPEREREAAVAFWMLESDGDWYRSPIVVLRY